MNILAIESSCDETSAAVIKDGTEIISNVVASSTAMHEKWGGIVPEVAAREQLSSIIPVLTEALLPLCHPEPAEGSQPNKGGLDSRLPASPAGGRGNDINIIKDNIDAIAVTVGPGLIGSLLIGIEAAKTMAFVTGIPIIPVNHVLAHMYANFMKTEDGKHLPAGKAGKTENSKFRPPPSVLRLPSFPAISLVVSGGHTELFLMSNEKELKWLGGTIDDAAGEAFDKTARLLGFGSRGGLAIQESAHLYCHPEPIEGSHPNEKRLDSRLRGNDIDTITIKLPRPMMHDDTLNFSFSGLKTAILREVDKLKEKNQLNDAMIQKLAFEVQEAITDVLVEKTIKAAKLHNAKSILISGGVASNIRLREKFKEAISLQSSAIRFYCPPIQLCTDNAAYIGSYAYFRGEPIDWHEITAIPDLSVEA